MNRCLFWGAALYVMGCGNVFGSFDEVWKELDELRRRIQCFHPITFGAFENCGVFNVSLSVQERQRSASVSFQSPDKFHVTRSSSAPLVAVESPPSAPDKHDIQSAFLFDYDIISNLSQLSEKFLAQIKECEDLRGSGGSFFGFLKSMAYTARRVMGLKTSDLVVKEWALNQDGISSYLDTEKREEVSDFLRGQKELNQKRLPCIFLSPKSYQDKKEEFLLHVFKESDLGAVFGADFVECLSSISGNLKDALVLYQQKTAEHEGDESEEEEEDGSTGSEEGAA